MVILYWISIICRGREVSRPYHAKSFGRLIQLLPRIRFITRGFSTWTASGFYPWCNVVSSRKRVAEGLCGGWHGNSFPMTQSAQSHRQMRSIPHCAKAVFLCFCFFDSIHDSATMHNFSTEVSHPYHTKPLWPVVKKRNGCGPFFTGGTPISSSYYLLKFFRGLFFVGVKHWDFTN